MRRTVVFGLALVALTLLYTSILPSGEELRIDLAPDFIGFLLIYLGLENITYRNRLLKELASISVFLSVVSFLTFAAQLAPFYASAFTDNIKFIAIAAVWIGSIYTKFEFLFIAVYMIYIAIFCIAFAKVTSAQTKKAPATNKFSYKNEYSEIIYSKRAYQIYTVFSVVFSVLFFIISVLSVVYHFTDISLNILGITTGLWISFLPVSILFVLYVNTAVNLVKDGLKERSTSAS